MILMKPSSLGFMALLLSLVLGGWPEGAQARDAAFADPGNFTTNTKVGSAGGDAIAVEPKPEMDTGESVINVARRATIFFVNKTNAPVEVAGVTINDDLNVQSSIVSNDCTREGKIGPGSRCSIVVEITAINIGPWATEVLLTHNGTGRIARAKLTGKAVSQSASDKKEAGFTLSTKEVKPIDFGQIDAAEAKAVRTALMINDSTENITLVSIDVIAAENGLERLEQGCVVDMELKPGESCPITLLWKPENPGQISTDLIIRHTGKLGFAVIPIRGVATDKNETNAKTQTTGKGGASKDSKKQGDKTTTAEDLEKALADRIPPLATTALPPSSSAMENAAPAPYAGSGEFRLIGTVGSRAILLKPDGTTGIVGINEEIAYGDGKKAKLTNVSAKTAEIFIDGAKKMLTIGAAQEITSKALSSLNNKDGSNNNKDSRRIDTSRTSSAPQPSSTGMGKQ